MRQKTGIDSKVICKPVKKPTVVTPCHAYTMKSLAFLLLFLCQSLSTAQEPPTCSAVEGERDPNLREMTYDVGDGDKSAWVYVDPDISSYYRMESPAQTKVTPKHNGFSGKFINMSAKPATLHW